MAFSGTRVWGAGVTGAGSAGGALGTAALGGGNDNGGGLGAAGGAGAGAGAGDGLGAGAGGGDGGGAGVGGVSRGGVGRAALGASSSVSGFFLDLPKKRRRSQASSTGRGGISADSMRGGVGFDLAPTLASVPAAATWPGTPLSARVSHRPHTGERVVMVFGVRDPASVPGASALSRRQVAPCYANGNQGGRSWSNTCADRRIQSLSRS